MLLKSCLNDKQVMIFTHILFKQCDARTSDRSEIKNLCICLIFVLRNCSKCLGRRTPRNFRMSKHAACCKATAPVFKSSAKSSPRHSNRHESSTFVIPSHKHKPVFSFLCVYLQTNSSTSVCILLHSTSCRTIH